MLKQKVDTKHLRENRLRESRKSTKVKSVAEMQQQNPVRASVLQEIDGRAF